jgi:hypothetical protein
MFLRNEPYLVQPPDDTPLWRYMDFSKFVSILDRSALYFARISTLGDPYEGVETRAYLEAAGRYYGTDKRMGMFAHRAEMMEAIRMKIRKSTFVSCWHMNTFESAAMWSQYLKSGEGVAIRSTFANFCKCFAQTPRTITGGVVEYLDYDTDLPNSPLEADNIAQLVCCKRKSFEHEREFRGMTSCDQPISPEEGDESGLYISLDVNTLIEEVYVAPHAATWQAQLVENVLAKYGFNKEVHHSKLYTRPDYLPPESLAAVFKPGSSSKAT